MEVTIGRLVADDTGLKIGDTFSSSHGFLDDENLEHDETSFKVVGILKATGSVIDQLILTPSSSVWESHDHSENDHGSEESTAEKENDHSEPDHEHSGHLHTNERAVLLDQKEKDITSILVKFKNKTNFQALNMPRNINENTDLQAASPPYEVNRLYSMIGTGTEAIRSLAIIIAIVSAISIFIFLFKSLKERKYELALMRVMGGSKTNLFTMIILEGLILALIGFLVGILLSHGAMEVMATYLKSDYRYSFTGWRWLSSEWGLLGLSLLIGFLAAVIPAFQASKTDINRTLSQT
jgi:putative ABC transport system permease protein